MRRHAAFVLIALLALAAPAAAHDHELEGGWTVTESGPRLGLPAAHVLRAAPVRGGALPPLGKFERLALQGGAGGAVGAPAGRSEPVRDGGSFKLQLHHTGIEASEPTLGVTKKGTIFFVGFGGLQVSTIVRSRDGGATWEPTNPVTPIEGDTTSFDPYIHVDEDTGRVFNADLSLVACSVISTSDDEGETFLANGQICQHTDHQNLFTGPAPGDSVQTPVGYPNVVYYCAIDGGAFFNFGTFTACSKSLDGGRTFARTGAPPFTDDPTRTGGHYGVQGHCGGNVAHGTVGRDGTVYLPRGWCDRPYLGISHDEGLTWERVQVADLAMAVGAQLEEHESSVAADEAGNLYYAWIAVDRLPYMVVSRDGGKTWTAPRMMAAPGVNEAWNVVLDAGDPGRVAFSYVGTTNSPGGPFCVKTTSDGCVTATGGPPRPASDYEKTTWNGYMGATYDALDPEPVFASAPVNDPATPIMRGAECGPSRCDAQFDFLDIDVAADGTAWAAYVDKRCDPDPAGGCPEAEGAVGHLFGGTPLVGPIPERPAPVAAAPAPAAPAAPPARPARCLSGRRLVVRVRSRRARVTANGRRVKVRRNRTAVVDLRKLGRNRKLTVRVVTRTRAGRRSTKITRYRTCA